MAIRAGEECRDVHFDVCYCSPLLRARETAELLLAGREIPIFYDERLKEMSFGIYEGMEYSFTDPCGPISTFFLKPEEYHPDPEEAEGLDELFERTGAFLREVIDPLMEQEKDVLIVGHGAMNSSIVCQVKQIPRKDYWKAGIENCKLMRLI